jgi:hypothetical protein
MADPSSEDPHLTITIAIDSFLAMLASVKGRAETNMKIYSKLLDACNDELRQLKTSSASSPAQIAEAQRLGRGAQEVVILAHGDLKWADSHTEKFL